MLACVSKSRWLPICEVDVNKTKLLSYCIASSSPSGVNSAMEVKKADSCGVSAKYTFFDLQSAFLCPFLPQLKHVIVRGVTDSGGVDGDSPVAFPA